MNTLTATTGYSSRIAAAPRATLPTATPAAAGAGARVNWLERLARWYELQPQHRRLGSYTMMK